VPAITPDGATDGNRRGFLMRSLPVGIGLSAGCVYVATAARDIVVGDSGEFLSAAATLGVAHPSGYPLLVLLGHAFSWLPIGPVAFRINLVAVVCGAVTVGLIFSLARTLGVGLLPAAIAAFLLAFNPLFWEWSLAVEAFPLNNALAAALMYCLVRWESEPKRTGFLVTAALCGGLGVANHLTIIFLIPFVLVVMWRRRGYVGARALVACVAAIALGLVPYLYIPWAASRHPFVNWGSIASATDLLRHFLRSDYGTGRLVAAGAASGSPLERLGDFAASFTILEGALTVLGAIEAYRHRRWFFWACALSFSLAGPAFVAYANIDVSNPPLLWALRRFFLLPHIIVAPLAAMGALSLINIVASRVSGERRRVESAVAVGAFALIVVVIAQNYASIDQRRNHVARDFAEDVLATLQPNTVLLALGDEVVFPVTYVQAVEKQRPDVTLVMLGLFRSFGWYISQLRVRDPALTIPFDRYDPGNPAATLRALVAANPTRQFALVGAPTDASLTNSYWLFHTGLVDQVEPMSKDIGLAVAAEENNRLLRIYRLPDTARIRRNTFEIGILAKYANAPAAMGDQFALAHLDQQAEAWYRRALGVDPEAVEARNALARLGTKTSR
jgi:hypothetical protein